MTDILGTAEVVADSFNLSKEEYTSETSVVRYIS